MRIGKTLGKILLSAVLLSAAALTETAKAEENVQPVGLVNGVTISKGEFDRNWIPYLQKRGIPVSHSDKSGQLNKFKGELLESMIEEELLFQEADKKGYLAGDEVVKKELTKFSDSYPSPEEFEKMLEGMGLNMKGANLFLQRRLTIRDYIEKEIADKITVTEEDIDAFYQENPDQFKAPERVRARHILIKAEEKADADTKAKAKEKIDKIAAEAKGGADFAELAKKHSEGPSGPEGGDLGFFARGRMYPSFEKAAFALKPGEISDVVETRFGYHVIKVEEKEEARTVPRDEVAEKLRGFLKKQALDKSVMEHVEELKKTAKIDRLIEHVQ